MKIKVLLLFFIILFFTINTYARYNYEFNLKAFNLTINRNDNTYNEILN